MPNNKLLRKVNAWVQKEAAKKDRGKETEWDQRTYWCATGHCFAGEAVLLSGGRCYKDLNEDGHETGATYCVMPGDRDERFVMHVAAELLGLSHKQAYLLFQSTNDAARIQELVDRFTKGEPCDSQDK